MDDARILETIDRLTAEEHRLEREHIGQGLNTADSDKLRQLETTLNQCWDLLRQRRARKSAGSDPEKAALRPAKVIESYQQ